MTPTTVRLTVLLCKVASAVAFAGVSTTVDSVPQSPWSRESVRLAQSAATYSATEMLTAPSTTSVCSGENLPTLEMTNGISVGVTRLCAAMSGQVYHSYEKGDFHLNMEGIPENELLLYDDHGMLRKTTTPFMVTLVPSEKTLILGWQGSTTLNDFIHDVAFSPMASSRFSKFTNNLRVHVGFAAFAENDLSLYQDFILNKILEHDVQDIVFTGHSLGGSIATLAHLFVLYMLRDRSSVWAQRLGEKADTLVARSINFCGPSAIAFFPDEDLEMTTPNDPAALQATLQFLNEMDQTSCVIVNNQDPTPRIPGLASYVEDMAQDYLVRAVKEKTPWFIDVLPFFDQEEWAMEQYDAFIDEHTDEETDTLVQILEIAGKFRHYGNVIFYESPTSKPLLLKDLKPPEGKEHDATPKYFSQIKYKKMDLKNEQFVDWLMKAHMGPVQEPGLAYQVPNKTSKMQKAPAKLDTSAAANWVPKILGK